MPQTIVMPQLGITMTEGSVLEWLKKPGEAVEKGELLFIVQTDKVDVEIEAPCAGTLTKILIEPGKAVPVGTVIATILSEEGHSNVASDSIQATAELTKHPPEKTHSLIMPSHTPARTASTESPSERVASPRAKKLAGELGLEISQIPDYGQRGRIVEADVRRFHQENKSGQTGANPVPTERGSLRPIAKEPLSRTRKAIAARMAASFRDVPHFYLDMLADATELTKLRQSLEKHVEAETGVHLTYSDLLLKALALALREHPGINVSWQGQSVVERNTIHLGLATQTAAQLIAPVIRDADRLSLPELARARSELISRARAGKLSSVDLEDASCTLSNLGPQGVDHFHAIINPPQSVILAVGTIKPRPLVVDATVLARQSVYLSLSVDHRVIDGALAAAFLRSIVRIIEAPYTLLLI